MKNHTQSKGDRCAKGTVIQKCRTIGCPTHLSYARQGLTCAFRVQENCGYANRYWEREGRLIRRQYFNWWIVLYSTILGFLFVRVIFNNLNDIEKLWRQTMIISTEWIFLLSATLILPIVMSLLNRHFWGRPVCLLNNEGLFCNQQKIRWCEIARITFHPAAPSRTGILRYAYVEITGKDLCVVLPHAPYHLLRAAKKYNPDIRTGVDRVSLISLAVMSAIAFVVLWLVWNGAESRNRELYFWQS